MTWYGMEGPVSKELLSFRGDVIVHDNPRELAWLFPKGQFRVVKLPASGLGRPCMRLRDHPDMAAVEWPLDPRKFR